MHRHRALNVGIRSAVRAVRPAVAAPHPSAHAGVAPAVCSTTTRSMNSIDAEPMRDVGPAPYLAPRNSFAFVSRVRRDWRWACGHVRTALARRAQ